MYISEAIAVEEAGTPLPPRPQEEIAEELQERLAGDPELSAAFDDRTPGRQREYNLHVTGPKQASTREPPDEKVTAIAPQST